MPHQTPKQKPLARVLAVEDHLEIGNLMRMALARSLIEATVITTGEEALKRLTTETFDLILLDIDLPGISGLEVCRQIKASPRLKGIPVIFVSGQSGPTYQDETKRLGAVDFIEKPFELLPFLSCIMGHLKLQTGGVKNLRQLGPLAVP
jgi:CheY-like chemotaxis protein